MTIEKLRYFVDSAELESFSAATEKNFVSQTAVSKQVHSLENEIGNPLFSVENNRIKLTLAGQFLYQRAKLILADLENAVVQTHQIAQKGKGSLRVGFTTTFEAVTAGRLLGQFQQHYPDVKLVTVQQTYQQNREGLLNHTLDLSVAVDYGQVWRAGDANLERYVVTAGEMVLAMSRHYRLANEKIVDGAQLTNSPIGFYNFDGTTEAPMGMLLNAQRDGYTLSNIRRFERLEELLLNVSLGNCVTFVPAGYQYTGYPNLVYRQLQQTSHHYEMLLVTSAQIHSQSLTRFLNQLKKEPTSSEADSQE